MCRRRRCSWLAPVSRSETSTRPSASPPSTLTDLPRISAAWSASALNTGSAGRRRDMRWSCENWSEARVVAKCAHATATIQLLAGVQAARRHEHARTKARRRTFGARVTCYCLARLGPAAFCRGLGRGCGRRALPRSFSLQSPYVSQQHSLVPSGLTFHDLPNDAIRINHKSRALQNCSLPFLTSQYPEPLSAKNQYRQQINRKTCHRSSCAKQHHRR
jgi:hypothetical protein